MNAWDPCPTGKSGRHQLVFFFLEADQGQPITAICEQCGMSGQYPFTWTSAGSLDDMSASAIAYWTSDKGTS